MGVPAFFRWLSRKYPSIVVYAHEEKGTLDADGNETKVDASKPNPNDVEFDNLYLDMNGIIHPCTHPENKPAPKNEDEMMVAIFEYIDRILALCRPRKLLYMAIDGVAPRAKMNQQRSRRFRASQESEQMAREVAEQREFLAKLGANVLPPKPASERFDSNCITPGTPFMFRLAECLRYYVHERLNSDPAWKDVKVILSDANVPGEGEHKIMDFIRKQRGQPDHDPNTHHILCGADADLIMLGLATHEPYFTIVREEHKQSNLPCKLCGMMGHEIKECKGIPETGQGTETDAMAGSDATFIFVRLNILREYLAKDLVIPAFKYDFERVIDDWIFLCFFVGNDFLPHLPSLQIREGAIDKLVKLYKQHVTNTKEYLTHAGEVYLDKVQTLLRELGRIEDEVFVNRRESDISFRQRNKRMKQQQSDTQANPNRLPAFMQAYRPDQPNTEKYNKQDAAKARNQQAAGQLKSDLLKTSASSSNPLKRSAPANSDSEPEDDVKLWQDGWKSRYYENKFGVGDNDASFRHQVADEYAIGLCWVLRYYFQGCASWKWFYPYHYAPFASDFENIGRLPNDFPRDTKPFRPFEQLMAVFPAGSKAHLPPSWRPLMYEPESAIIDFYPTSFRIDLNGKKFAWMGVALLPFVDEQRLLKAVQPKYAELTADEQKRSIRGCDQLFVSQHSKVYDFLTEIYEHNDSKPVTLATNLTGGLLGSVGREEFVSLPNSRLKAPINLCEDIPNNQAIMVKFSDPVYGEGYVYTAKFLPGAKIPATVLGHQHFQTNRKGEYKTMEGTYMHQQMSNRGRGRGGFGGQHRPQLGFTPSSGYRTDKDPASANRMLRASLDNTDRHNRGGGQHSNRGNNYYGPARGASPRFGGQSSPRQSRPPRGSNFGGGSWPEQNTRRFERPSFQGPSHSTSPRPYANQQQRGHRQDFKHQQSKRGHQQHPYRR